MKYLDLWSPGLRICFEKFVKPSAPPTPSPPPPTPTYLMYAPLERSTQDGV